VTVFYSSRLHFPRYTWKPCLLWLIPTRADMTNHFAHSVLIWCLNLNTDLTAYTSVWHKHNFPILLTELFVDHLVLLQNSLRLLQSLTPRYTNFWSIHVYQVHVYQVHVYHVCLNLKLNRNLYFSNYVWIIVNFVQIYARWMLRRSLKHMTL